jgi:hypothetical protein
MTPTAAAVPTALVAEGEREESRGARSISAEKCRPQLKSAMAHIGDKDGLHQAVEARA